jgi:hypothetical protein
VTSQGTKTTTQKQKSIEQTTARTSSSTSFKKDFSTTKKAPFTFNNQWTTPLKSTTPRSFYNLTPFDLDYISKITTPYSVRPGQNNDLQAVPSILSPASVRLLNLRKSSENFDRIFDKLRHSY